MWYFKRNMMIILLVVCIAFISTKISFAGIEEVLMPEAKIFVKGKLPSDCTVKTNLILNDQDLNAVQINDFVVWSEVFEKNESVELIFALSENGGFLFGANGQLPDILSVVGLGCVFGGYKYMNKDDGVYTLKDIGLVGFGICKLKELQDKNYITGVAEDSISFADSCSIEVKHNFEKNFINVFHRINIYRGNENYHENYYDVLTKNWAVSYLNNSRWCQFASPFDNGTAYRSFRISYNGEIASFVKCYSWCNTGEESWVKLDGEEILHTYDTWSATKLFYNFYPEHIEMGGIKRWTQISPFVAITILGDAVTISDLNENPSLGQRKNPPPDILTLEPNIWYGEYITYSPEKPMVVKAVSFDASSAFDPDEIASYEWDFGDENTGSGDKVDHIYSQPGEYDVTLTVSKNNGEVAKSSLTVTIKDFQLSKLETIGAHVVGFDIGDVDNDNSDELVSTDPINKRIAVYNDQYNLKYSIPLNESPRTVLISDIDNDGKNEIIVGTATGAGYDSSGYAYIGEVLSNGDFVLEWKSPPYCLKWADEMAVGDLNANGRKELIMGLAGNDDKLVSYEYTGSTYSLIFTENIGSDVDSVSVAEDKLFVGTSCTSDYGMRVYNKYNMEFYDLNDGSTCVSAGDINGDGKIEIVRAIGGKCEYVSDYYTTQGLVGIHSYPRPSFSIYDDTYSKVFTSTELSVESVPRHVFVTTGELLPGGGEEIAVGIRSETHEIINKIRVYRYNGATYEEVWNDDLGDVTNDVYHLKVADIDGDGQNELYVSTTYGLRIYEVNINKSSCFTDEFLSTVTASSIFGEPRVYIGIGLEEIKKEAPPCNPGPSFCLTLMDPDSDSAYFKEQRLCRSDFDLYHWIVKIEKIGFIDPDKYPLLSWNPGELPQKEGYVWMLVKGENENGEILVSDMKGTGSYQVKVEDGEYFSILWTNNINYTLHLQKGWNMISLPVVSKTMARSALFPQALAVWQFDPNQMMYVYIEEDDPLENNISYWALVEQEMDQVLSGPPVTQYTLGLKQTWNMIGALFDQTSISLSQGTIEALYGFKDGSYFLLEEPPYILEPGMGYWILPSDECVLSANVTQPHARLKAGEFSARRYRTGDSFEMIFTAFGQKRDGYSDKGVVTLGVSDTSRRVFSPPPLPKYTILFSILDLQDYLEYAYDIRSDKPDMQTWALWVQNKPIPGSGYYPLLSWELTSFSEGTLELRKGDSGTGDILVPDMLSVSSYQMSAGDGELLTIVWRNGVSPSKTYYLDDDGDGYGDPDNSRELIAPEGKYTALTPGDCNDSDPGMHPGALEICDEKDNNCNDEIDEGVKNKYYRDADNDGYGDPLDTIQACTEPSGFVSNNLDCNDSDPSIYQGCTCTNYYRDSDGDGYGLTSDYQCLSSPEGEYTALYDGDSNDGDPTVYPRTIRVINTEGYPGQIHVSVPIEVENVTGITGVDIVLRYNPNVLIIKDVTTTSLIQGFMTYSNIKQHEGRISLVIANSTGLTSDSGTLAEIILDVSESAEAGTLVPMVFEEILFYNENAESCDAILTNGQFLIVEEYIGDLDGNKDITSADSVLILKIIVSLITPDDYQLRVSDVNKDSMITAADAILVLKAAVGIKTIFCLQPKSGMADTPLRIYGWNFGDTQNGSNILFGNTIAFPIYWSDHEILATVPSDTQGGLVNINISTPEEVSNCHRFTVLENSMPRLKSENDPLYSEGEAATEDLIFHSEMDQEPSDKLNVRKVLTRRITVPLGMAAGPCDRITIPIEVDNATNIAGMDLVLEFDPAILIPVKAESTLLTEGFIVLMGDLGDGQVIVSSANAQGIDSGNGTLFDITFKVSSDAEEFDSTGLIIKHVDLYDENADSIEGVISFDGELTINGVGSCSEGKTFLVDTYVTQTIYSLPYYDVESYPWLIPFYYPNPDKWQVRPCYLNVPFGSIYDYQYGYQSFSQQTLTPAFYWKQNSAYYNPWTYPPLYLYAPWLISWLN